MDPLIDKACADLADALDFVNNHLAAKVNAAKHTDTPPTREELLAITGSCVRTLNAISELLLVLVLKVGKQ